MFENYLPFKNIFRSLRLKLSILSHPSSHQPPLQPFYVVHCCFRMACHARRLQRRLSSHHFSSGLVPSIPYTKVVCFHDCGLVFWPNAFRPVAMKSASWNLSSKSCTSSSVWTWLVLRSSSPGRLPRFSTWKRKHVKIHDWFQKS